MRRGPEQDIPGKPTTLAPLAFEPGLDVGEIGFATDTGRLFIGQLPNYGQPNYRRTDFPYQNIEVLTEASIETLRKIFNFLNRDQGSGSFYKATLDPTDPGVYEDIRVERALGSVQPFHIAGEEVMATIEYYVAEQDQYGMVPLRNGVLKVLSDHCASDALVKDDALTIRRLDLETPDALDVNEVFENIAFRVSRGGAIGERYFRFMYTTTGIDKPVKIWFRVERPLTDTTPAGDYSNTSGTPGVTGYSREDIEDIVGQMVSGNAEVGINVTYNDCAGKLDFRTLGEQVQYTFSYDLVASQDLTGTVRLDTSSNRFSFPLTLVDTGVRPGRYTNPVITVDSKGRVTAIQNGTVSASDPDAVYGGENIGGGSEVFAAKSGRNLQFRTIRGTGGITIAQSGTDLTISANIPSSLTVRPAAAAQPIPSVNDVTFAGNAVQVADNGSGKITVTINQPASVSGGGSIAIADVNGHRVAGASLLTFKQNAVTITANGSGADATLNFVDLATKQTANGEKTFNANTFVTNGALTITNPNEAFAGIEVPVNSTAAFFSGAPLSSGGSTASTTGSAYFVFEPTTNTWTAYKGTSFAARTLGDVTANAFIGNASTAYKLYTPRTIAMTGDLVGNAAFDGSQNIAIPVKLAGGIPSNDSAINIGNGRHVFAQKSGSVYQFKTLVAGANVSLVEGSDTITISAAGGTVVNNGGGGTTQSSIYTARATGNMTAISKQTVSCTVNVPCVAGAKRFFTLTLDNDGNQAGFGGQSTYTGSYTLTRDGQTLESDTLTVTNSGGLNYRTILYVDEVSLTTTAQYTVTVSMRSAGPNSTSDNPVAARLRMVCVQS